MSTVKDTLWELFEDTGSINYYLMYKAIERQENEKE